MGGGWGEMGIRRVHMAIGRQAGRQAGGQAGGEDRRATGQAGGWMGESLACSGPLPPLPGDMLRRRRTTLQIRQASRAIEVGWCAGTGDAGLRLALPHTGSLRKEPTSPRLCWHRTRTHACHP